ncbi:MAG: PLP-dependent aminotransferase family protein, partial [Anaerolineales bacterium]|nr:PLP-dependent aminotransferase family protein [Anaerolineales bacterium]
RVTVLQAYEQLEVDGFVEGRTGAGTYVAHNLPVNGRRCPLEPRPEPFQPALSRWGTRLTNSLSHLPRRYPTEIDFTPGRVRATGFPYDLWRRTVGRVLNNGDELLTHSGAAAGYRPLREAIANHLMRQRGVQCRPEQVVIVSGVQQAVDILARLLLQSGDEVLVETPGSRAVYRLLQTHGAHLSPLLVGDAGFSVSTIQTESQARLALVTPAHQFPHGGGLPLPQRLALLAWAKRQQAVIIEDDTDGDLRYGERPLTALQGLDDNGHVVYLGDLSRLMFPALGLGYVVLPLSLKRPFVHAKRLLHGNIPLPNQIALADFMREGHFETHLRQLRRIYQERWETLTTALDKEIGNKICFSRAAAGTHLLVYLPTGVNEKELVRETAVCGVGIAPGTPYHLQRPVAPSILLSFSGLTQAEIEEGVRRLAKILLN